MVEERFAVIEGAQAWSSAGSGERANIGLLLVHGLTGNPVSLRPLGEALAKRGFRVSTARLPGHGTHWRDLAGTRYSDWRGEVVRGAKELGERCTGVVLVGLSMGGTLVLDVAADAIEGVRGVVAVNAQILDRKGILAKLAPYIGKVVPVVPSKAAGLTKNDIAKGGDERAYDYLPAAAGNSLLAELPRVREALTRVTCPALVAYSVQDHSVPPDNSKAALQLLGSHDKAELVLERSYHLAALDYDAPLLEQRISDFAERVAAR